MNAYVLHLRLFAFICGLYFPKKIRMRQALTNIFLILELTGSLPSFGGCTQISDNENSIKDSIENQVVHGRYKVTAEYSNNPSGYDSKTVSTKTFFIRQQRSSVEYEDNKN